MALDYLAVDISAKTFPFQQQVSFNASRYSTVPWGQAIVNESFQTPAIGAGNTGLISLDIELPSDYVAMMRTFHLQVIDTATIEWRDACFGFAYQQPGGPYKNSVTEYPEDEYSWYQLVPDELIVPDRFGTTIRRKFWTFGTAASAAGVETSFDSAWDPTQVPLWIPPSIDSTFRQRQCVGYIENQTASQPAAECTLRASFDLYTFEQAYSAAVMSSPRVFS